jgi:FtsP/CotA-like multicopper oxidase with cupredoxin domain
MFEETSVKDQAGEEDRNESSNIEGMSEVTRRSFLQQIMLVASGLALSPLLPPFTRKSLAETLYVQACPPGQTLQDIMEISTPSRAKTAGQTLQAVLKILDEKKTYLAPGCVTNTGQMRFFQGYDETNPSKVWPSTKGVPSPGPTFRARVGDTVQITLLNHVNVKNFPGTLDVAEQGSSACDQAKSVGPDGTSMNTYPGDPSFENPPNCYHGSSSTNLHFHGTHMSPSGISDNVLLNIRPSPRGADGKPTVNEQNVKPIFDKIFAACDNGSQPMLWKDWPVEWQSWQKKLLTTYDETAVWQGKPGNLPHDQQLWPQNENEMAHNQLPQYYIGAFPTCFKIAPWNGQPDSMGQAPGTHWYHAHKHGSTSLNLSNGMAGALIIEGDYDDFLKSYITRQRVMVIQTYAAVISALRSGFATQPGDSVFVNGQFTPVMQMNPNEMQLWRIINACSGTPIPLNAPTGIKWVQTAQDGVQFDRENYNPDDTDASFPVPARSVAPFGSLAAGNRIDLLVQAPSTPGTYPVTFGSGNTLLFTVKVEQDSSPPITSPMPFPLKEKFPQIPDFLKDINPAGLPTRELRFKSTPAKDPKFPNQPATHTIDDKQFSMNKINQTMQLGTAEVWTLYNDGGAAHPFHIHVNPFQVLEIMDPKQNGGAPVKLPRPWVWWDNFAIPTGGYVRIATRFVDYTGMFVLHCHILDHEDRGMMQLVQVVSDKTTMQHK